MNRFTGRFSRGVKKVSTVSSWMLDFPMIRKLKEYRTVIIRMPARRLLIFNFV